jgi:hypothetical protein
MLAESLVVLACLQQTGCSETASQYKVYNPLPFEVTEQYTQKLTKAVLFNYWGPALGYVTGRSGSISLYGPLRLNLNQKYTELLLRIEY